MAHIIYANHGSHNLEVTVQVTARTGEVVVDGQNADNHVTIPPGQTSVVRYICNPRKTVVITSGENDAEYEVLDVHLA